MIVCSCRRVCHRTVSAAVVAGASTLGQLADLCGAGGRCQGCHPELERIIESHVDVHARTARPSAA